MGAAAGSMDTDQLVSIVYCGNDEKGKAFVQPYQVPAQQRQQFSQGM